MHLFLLLIALLLAASVHVVLHTMWTLRLGSLS